MDVFITNIMYKILGGQNKENVVKHQNLYYYLFLVKSKGLAIK
jgi:hypothetical protein